MDAQGYMGWVREVVSEVAPRLVFAVKQHPIDTGNCVETPT